MKFLIDNVGQLRILLEITSNVLTFVAGSLGNVLRLIWGSNVEPKCGNNSSENLHMFLRCVLVPVLV